MAGFFASRLVSLADPVVRKTGRRLVSDTPDPFPRKPYPYLGDAGVRAEQLMELGGDSGGFCF